MNLQSKIWAFSLLYKLAWAALFLGSGRGLGSDPFQPQFQLQAQAHLRSCFSSKAQSHLRPSFRLGPFLAPGLEFKAAVLELGEGRLSFVQSKVLRSPLFI